MVVVCQIRKDQADSGQLETDKKFKNLNRMDFTQGVSMTLNKFL